mmetsp:Transcript_37664/g.6763  ORF Transcript_37664/g.6763 Transcript_37664/m.6763 type:complete len:105 (+) Transcript_37664:280-594(+)
MSFYGLVFIVPLAVPYEGPMALVLLLVLVLVDIPAIFISSYLINPETMGRKNSLRYSIAITGIFFVIAGILAISILFFVTFLLLAKIGIVIYFSTLFPFTSELY